MSYVWKFGFGQSGNIRGCVMHTDTVHNTLVWLKPSVRFILINMYLYNECILKVWMAKCKVCMAKCIVLLI